MSYEDIRGGDRFGRGLAQSIGLNRFKKKILVAPGSRHLKCMANTFIHPFVDTLPHSFNTILDFRHMPALLGTTVREKVIDLVLQEFRV